MGLQRVRHDWATNTHERTDFFPSVIVNGYTHTHIHTHTHTHTHTCMFYVLFSHYLWTSFLFSGNLLSCRVCHLICNSDLSPDGRRVLGMKSSSGLHGRPDTKSDHVLVCLCLFSSLLIRISQKWGLLILVIGFSHGEAPPKYPGNLPCFL